MRPPCRTRVVERLLYAALVGLTVWLGTLAHLPDSEVAPDSMLALAFPGTRSGAMAMLAPLRQDDYTRAATYALVWDYAFMLAYGLLLWLTVRWAVRKLDPPGAERRLANRFARLAPLFAVGFDMLENAGLLMLLNWPELESVGLVASATTLAALAKWTLLIFVVSYLAPLLGSLWWRSLMASSTKPTHGAP